MNKRLLIFLQLLSILIPFIALFCTGILFTIFQSFGFFIFKIKYSDLFFAYKELFLNKWFYESFIFSIKVAFFSALISIIIGTIFSYLLWKLPLNIQKYLIIYKIPLILPHITVAFIIIIIFSKTGILSSFLYNIGLIVNNAQFPSLLYQKSGFDIITAYIYKEVPFVILMVFAVLIKFDIRLIETAKMLGAGRIKIFFKIVLPFLFPVINTTFIILFIYSFGAFDIPFIIGQSYPGMLSIHVFNYFFEKDLYYRPIAMAILIIMLIFSIIFIYIYIKIAKKVEMSERKI